MSRAISQASTVVLGFMLASAAQAQGSAPAANAEADNGIEDIIITATKQATNLQDTPIAITAVTSEVLENRAINNVADLSSVVPNGISA